MTIKMSIHYSIGSDLEHEKQVIKGLAKRPEKAICRFCRYSVIANLNDSRCGRLLCTRFGGETDRVTGDVIYPTCESRRVPLRETRRHEGGPGNVQFTTRSEHQYCGELGVRWEAREKGSE